MHLFIFRFDLAVNGGGAVTLQFQRSPFRAVSRTTHVGWNRIVVVDDVVMTSYAVADANEHNEEHSEKVSGLIGETTKPCAS